MTLTKIGDAFSPAVTDATDYHYGAYTDDGKVWLVSRTGHEQKSQSWFHRVAYAGGYLINFNTKTKKWGEKVTFPALTQEENMEDVLFAVGSHLLLLLYSRFDGLKYHALYEWTVAAKNWQKITEFEVDPDTESAHEGRNELAAVPTPDGLYLIGSCGRNVSISKLTVKPHGDHIDKAQVSAVGSLAEDAVPFYHSGHVVMGGAYKDKLALIGGNHGCGFRWEPTKPTLFSLNDKTAAKVETKDDTIPPFGYSGSRETVVLPDGRWLHITGSTAHGMTGTTYNGQVWFIDLNKDELQWHKTPLEIHEDSSGCVVVDSHHKKIYAAGLNTGVFEGHL